MTSDLPSVSTLVAARATLSPRGFDSELFGVRIAQLEAEPVTGGVLHEAVLEALHHGIECIYLTMRPSPGALGLPERYGFRLVDVQMRLARPTSTVFDLADHPALEVAPAEHPVLSSLDRVLATIVPWSRFSADPRFDPGSVLQMYRVWVEQAACRPDQLLAVARFRGVPEGLVACDGNEGPRIGLLGVAAPGLGIGARLVVAALEWARGRGPALSVRTQARNVAALRFYQRTGFSIEEVRYVYHCWPRETAAPR